ncbi:acyl-CoA--sterol O-acyltransferase 1-like [Coffea eugenioides]|uniref:acyl-CoA--sterol O-acyltransferase 1-like n=1 Tax=Coffea eugenioides TaxID=49369 RepID=UPI000F610955|nr:acyl-CoA--sterol O-acyltransferase 1-like [Coffea eugenioides]
MEGEIKDVIKYWVEGEISNFVEVWLSVYVSLCYCYLAGKIVPKGMPRFLAFLPIICLFVYLPLKLHTLHLGVTTAFFVAWLSNFKLLMFAFHRGPLSDPSLSFPRFIALACLPIRIRQKPPPEETPQNGHPENTPPQKESSKKKSHRSVVSYATKGVLLASMIKLYDYSDQINPLIIWILYCFHMYFALEIILAIVATMARVSLGAELEPTFNEPLFSSSLQDFWGRRWNLMVTRILRPSVYEPVHKLAEKLLGRELASVPAVLGTFVVSALMHELIFYYMGRARPTGKLTGFFLLHGVCMVVEVAAKKALKSRWRLPRFLSTALVVVFVMVTGLWLFLPEMLRNNADVRALKEYAAIGAFVRDVGRALAFVPSGNATSA